MSKRRIILNDSRDRTEQVVPVSHRRERVGTGLGAANQNFRPSPPEYSGTVSVSGLLMLSDSEMIGGGTFLGMKLPDIDTKDEYVTLNNLTATSPVDINLTRRFYWEGRCGGEIRFEVDMVAGIKEGDPNTLEFQTSAYLFEGTSTDTTDLDGYKYHDVEIPRGQTRSVYLLVTNTDENDPNDYGVASFSVTFS